jgi:hypothetical protein
MLVSVCSPCCAELRVKLQVVQPVLDMPVGRRAQGSRVGAWPVLCLAADTEALQGSDAGCMAQCVASPGRQPCQLRAGAPAWCA